VSTRWTPLHVPAHIVMREDGANCDRCGADIPSESYDGRSFECHAVTGSSFPEGACLTGWAIDHACDACAEAMREALEKLGFRFRRIDRDDNTCEPRPFPREVVP